MHDKEGSADEPALVSTRTMDIVVALLFLVVSAVVIVDSLRLGMDWRHALFRHQHLLIYQARLHPAVIHRHRELSPSRQGNAILLLPCRL